VKQLSHIESSQLIVLGTEMVVTSSSVLLLLLVEVTIAGLSSPPLGSSQSGSSRKLPPCQLCKVLVTSFQAGIDKTAMGQFTGGDAAWVEENRKTYKDSELRLTEIQEMLCSDVTVGKDHCHEFATNNEDLLEEWWSEEHKRGIDGEDLMPWLCITRLKVCCKDNHFGPECQSCPGLLEGGHDRVCSGHGKCKGNGTRKGSGECSCSTGYAGSLCDQCAPSFFQVQKDNNPLSCSACHKACAGCTGPGAKNCEKCKEGWEFDTEMGCTDVNECMAEKRVCKWSEFCQNMDGSYSCLACDKSCESCFGDGPDMCDQCAPDYTMVGKVCLDNATVERQKQLSTTRYLTYCGLALVSLVVLQKNALLASIMGVGFGLYIAATEWFLLGQK